MTTEEANAPQTSDASADFTQARDPLALFDTWLGEAVKTEPNDPNAMSLATVNGEGRPNVRIVLLKGHDERGFVFYTNFEGVKGTELLARPVAALCFHWKTRRRQVRLRGSIEIVADGEADTYYRSRPLGSRIGAWASQQSRPLGSRDELIAAVHEAEQRLGDDPDRPAHWGGFRLVPDEIEFWQDGEFRLHDRVRFTRKNGGEWRSARLYP